METKLHPISRAEALTILVENSLNSGRWRARGVPALGRVVAGADCYRLSVGTLDEAVRAIQEIVEAPSRVVR